MRRPIHPWTGEVVCGTVHVIPPWVEHSSEKAALYIQQIKKINIVGRAGQTPVCSSFTCLSTLSCPNLANHFEARAKGFPASRCGCVPPMVEISPRLLLFSFLENSTSLVSDFSANTPLSVKTSSLMNWKRGFASEPCKTLVRSGQKWRCSCDWSQLGDFFSLPSCLSYNKILQVLSPPLPSPHDKVWYLLCCKHGNCSKLWPKSQLCQHLKWEAQIKNQPPPPKPLAVLWMWTWNTNLACWSLTYPDLGSGPDLGQCEQCGHTRVQAKGVADSAAKWFGCLVCFIES